MKRVISLILLFSFTFCACSHVIPKYQNESEQDFCNRINKLTNNTDVSLKMISEKVYFGKELRVNSDSTSFHDFISSSSRKVATNEIFSISFSEGERGAWEGLLYGTFIGGMSGLLPNIILPKGTGHPSGNPLIIVYGALAGAVIGVVYGFINESQTTIELSN